MTPMEAAPDSNPTILANSPRESVAQLSTVKARKPKDADFPDDLWSAVHSDYRTGTTYGKLSEIYGIPVALIVARKQRQGWLKDLREDVQVQVMATLASDSLDSASSRGFSDEELVQRAANKGAKVVQRHRQVLEDSLIGVSKLAGVLRVAVEDVAAGKVPTNISFLGPKETLSEVALKLGNALSRIVPLERKAHGLEEGNDQRPMEDQLRDWYARQRAEQAASGG